MSVEQTTIENLRAKILNKTLTGKKFVDKDIDNYIYASLTQPPIKILDKNGSDNELDYTVECPNCHKAVNYGEEIFMYSGHIYCSNSGCRKQVISNYEKGRESK